MRVAAADRSAGTGDCRHPLPAGSGRLRIARAASRSCVVQAAAASPLRLLTPGNRGAAAWVFTSTYGGGLVGGDSIDLAVDVDAGAAALLSTQASTKVYRSSATSRTDLRARVAPGALLVCLPDPVVCFASSRYEQAQSFDLSSEASLVCLDWMTSGRRARGERWAFHRYHTSLTVASDGRLVCVDATTLDDADGPLAGRLGGTDVLATLVLAGPLLAGDVAHLLDRYAGERPGRRPGRIWSVSPIGPAGCLVRMAGETVDQVGRAVRACLECVPGLLGDDPWARKW